MKEFNVLSRGVLRDLFGVGGAIQGGASIAAATLQAKAANHASDLAKESADASLGFNRDVFNQQQANQAPWLQAGKTALGQLATGTTEGGQFGQKYGKEFDPGKFTAGTFDPGGPFKAPTGVDQQNDPGYQFRLQEGQKALERSAAARGAGTGGAALKAAARYGQDYASNEYGNVYGRALNTYNTNFNSGLNAFNANQTAGLNAFNTNTNAGQNAFNTNYNVWNQGQSNDFNRLASLAGLGQTAAGQLGANGAAAAGNVSAINSNLGNNLSNLATQSGNAIGAGIVGAGNAISNGITNYNSNQMLQRLLQGSSYGQLPAGLSYNVPYQPELMP